LSLKEIAPLDAAALLRRHGLRPDRRLGQNFLQDTAALQEIAAAATITAGDTVLEIGCGLGSLTRHLALLANHIVAVERDRHLFAIAQDVLRSYPNVQLICADILSLSARDLRLPPGYLVAANIPYNITSPILRNLLESEPLPRRIVLTVQKEVAERICALPPRMSILALSVQVYGRTEIVGRIPAGAFFPVPRVDSAVVRIEIRGEPMIPLSLLPAFFRLVNAAFGQKRKMLRNSLSSRLGLSSAEAESLLKIADVDPRRRPQTLDFADWERLLRTPELPGAGPGRVKNP
jgi:16S rRNA (adenine1518-N6/adenine1519-N6)-dimethyltransferase